MTFSERLAEFFTPKSYYKDLYKEEKEKNVDIGAKLAETEKTSADFCNALFYDSKGNKKNELFQNLITCGQKEFNKLNGRGITLFDFEKDQREMTDNFVVSINDIKFNSSHFDKAIFQNVSFDNCYFDDAFFTESNFKNMVDFNNCTFGDCSFTNSEFKNNVTFNNCDFGYCHFAKTNFRENINFSKCKFYYSDFSEAISNNSLAFTNCEEINYSDSKGHTFGDISYMENKNDSLIINNCKKAIPEIVEDPTYNVNLDYDYVDEDEFEM